MHYQISRNGQMYGPYTIEDLQRYLASGNVLPTDLAKSEEMSDWLPVSQILAGAQAGHTAESGFTSPSYAAPEAGTPVYAPAGLAPQVLGGGIYQSAPNLHWGLVLLFSLLTCSFFMFVWNLVIAAWLKRVQPNATSLFYYIGAAVLTLVQFTVGVPFQLHHVMTPGIHTHYGNPVSGLIGLAVWIVRLIARYSQRASLEEHYNGPEPIGLRLSAVMTFFFGGLYFQYHLNRINQIKTMSAFGAPRGY